MEDAYELELTYVTERIIALCFPRACAEDAYRANLQGVTRMLKSKHGDSYLVINLSEKRQDLSKINSKVMDLGWPDLHAPPLDRMCTICKAMESWLNADLQHVVVIHCRGGKGRIGVVISSFVHFTDISASANQALERFTMRKFYDDKVSTLMSPSQKRYVWILNSLLTGSIKMNTSPLFLHCVILHGVPDFDTAGACRPYLKVYQGMQAVYSSGIYNIGAGHRNRVYIVLQPAQLLKGDILVKCYHKNVRTVTREVIFHVQFHTGAVQGYSLIFEKEDLEVANKDARFPDYGKVELVLSESPEKIQGSDHWRNVPDIAVDYNTTDPLIRWDSYQNLSCDGEVPHVHVSPDATSGTKVRQRNRDGSTPGLVALQGVPQDGASDHSNRTLSTSSDSGFSSASAQTGRLPRSLCGPGSRDVTESKRPPSRPGPIVGMSERSPPTRGQRATVNGDLRKKQQETELLDEEVPAHDLRSVGSIGTLSSDGPYCSYHKSSQNSLLSDGIGSNDTGTEDGFERPCFQRNGSVSQDMHPQAFGETGYTTQSWVRHQQMVAAQQYLYSPSEGSTRLSPGTHGSPHRPNVPPDTPTRGSSSRDAVQRAGSTFHRDATRVHASDELSSLTVDIDQSIDQLNQLIMDLDPTFVPVYTQSSSIGRDGMAHTNGLASGRTNGMSYRRLDSGGTEAQNPCQSASDVGRDRKYSPSRHDGVADDAGLRPSGWGSGEELRNSPVCKASQITLQPDRVDNRYRSEEAKGRVPAISEVVPPTPAFPFPPPTPYVRDHFDFPHVTQSPQGNPASGPYRTQLESRGYLENPGHGSLTPDVPVSFSLSPTQRPLVSMHSVSTDNLLPWSERALQSHQSSHGGFAPKTTGQHQHGSPGLYHSTPGCQSSPRAVKGGPAAKYPQSRSPGQGFEDHDGSCSRKVEVTLNGGLELPPLPEKRRVSQGEQSLGSTSPAPSGFSSPPSAGFIGTPASDGKQENAKFVQDTSKFWYKPDISRDQAIALLKEKEPGSFIVRDSHSFRGAYGLAMKVAAPPPTVLQQSKRVLPTCPPFPLGCTLPPAGGDLSNELVRHFLIECTQKGVRLKGCPNEPYFGSLTALVCHHAITPLALPCKLIIPERGERPLLTCSPPCLCLHGFEFSDRVSPSTAFLSPGVTVHRCWPTLALCGRPCCVCRGGAESLTSYLQPVLKLDLSPRCVSSVADPLEEVGNSSSQTAANSAAELLKQGAACNVWFLGSMDMESLTGYQAVQKATSMTLSMDPPPTSTVVHFKVSTQGITLTDNQRKLFFRRHYAVSTVIFCALDPQDRKWTRDGCSSAKIFGFVARKSGSATENVCHLFAEHDPEQPASAIVNFISKVMIGSQRGK
ncbi:tensin-3-like isoform X1 [Scleropages formosus]|uniref:tensin-3-like isoform X1 n=1 Tax=Scleropages formosus TaxID=113540 RepID=UPI0010FA7093|nr:tensin-3-like isoform X1 [Scleropages formosus]